MERYLRKKRITIQRLSKVDERLSIVRRVVVGGRLGEVSDGVGRALVLPPVIETAPGFAVRVRPLLPAAVCHLVVMPVVTLGLPRCVTLAVRSGRGRDLDGGIHVVEAVGDGGGGAPAVFLRVVVERPEMPFPPEVARVVLVGLACGVTDRERALGGELEGRDALGHVAAPVHIVDAVSEVVAAGEDGGASGGTDGPPGVEVLL